MFGRNKLYEKFTDRARKVMQLANEEAQRFNQEFIGTEHILLGLAKEGEGVAAHVLKDFGLDLPKLRSEVKKIVWVGPDMVIMGMLPLTPRVKKAIEYAIEEVHNLDHGYVGTEHLLLGLVRKQEGVAAQVLMNLGIKLEDVRKGVLNLLGCSEPYCEEQAHEPSPKRWTREEYYRLGECGFFQDQRVELIEGEILVLGRQTPQHCTTMDRVRELLHRVLGDSFWVRMRCPLNLGTSDPEPDVSVVAGQLEDYHDHPTTAALIVEVSERSLNYDRSRKASLYARAGIADYWIVNLVDREVEVYRDPQPNASQPYGHGYGRLIVLTAPAVISPLAQPQVSLAVADLLP